MSYITADEMKKLLDVKTTYRDRLYCRGFLITNDKLTKLSEYPFYNNWNEFSVNTDCGNYFIYTQKYVNLFTFEDAKRILFIIGHAYNPFSMQYDEKVILKDLSTSFNESEETFWDVESELTGVFCLG